MNLHRIGGFLRCRLVLTAEGGPCVVHHTFNPRYTFSAGLSNPLEYGTTQEFGRQACLRLAHYDLRPDSLTLFHPHWAGASLRALLSLILMASSLETLFCTDFSSHSAGLVSQHVTHIKPRTHLSGCSALMYILNQPLFICYCSAGLVSLLSSWVSASTSSSPPPRSEHKRVSHTSWQQAQLLVSIYLQCPLRSSDARM